MSLWTNEDINRILTELDARELPFKKFSFNRSEGKLILLGKGGSANVYDVCKRGHNEGGYAIKVIGFWGQNIDSDFFIEGITAQDEARAYQDNIVKVYDHTELWVSFDKYDNIISVSADKNEVASKNFLKLQFVLMERVRPVIWRTKMRDIRLVSDKLERGDEAEILKMAYDIGLALRNAHRRNILHRDIKLENVFYSEKDDQYKLGDFGIAKRTKDGFADTVAFTKGYVAPEARSTDWNDRYDHTADIYSFGIMLFVLANGLKFPDSNTYNVNNGIQYSKGYILPRPEKSVSEGFYNVMLKACMYDPDMRYQSMDEMLLDIEKLMHNKSLGYKKEHKGESLLVGMTLLIIGMCTWKLTMAPYMTFSLSVLEYIFMVGGVAKGIQKYRGKRTEYISLVMFCVGIFIFFYSGISWRRLVVVSLMVLSSGGISGCIGVGILIVNVVSVLQTLSGTIWMIDIEYSWIVFALISLAIVLLFQYCLISMEDRKVFYKFYEKGLYWNCVWASYVMLILMGTVYFRWMRNIWQVIFDNCVDDSIKMNLILVGTSGLVFTIYWILREKINGERKEKRNL